MATSLEHTQPAEQRRRKGQRGQEKVGGRQSRRQTRDGHPRARARRPRGVRPQLRHQAKQKRRPLPLHSRAGQERAAGETKPPTRAPLERPRRQDGAPCLWGQRHSSPHLSLRDWQPLWLQMQRQNCAQRVESQWRTSPSWGGLPSCGPQGESWGRGEESWPQGAQPLHLPLAKRRERGRG